MLMLMVVEVIRVDVVAQEETWNLTEMLSFKEQKEEKGLLKRVVSSSRVLVL